MKPLKINQTCEPLDLRKCKTGTFYIDACSCRAYYECIRVYDYSTTNCPNSTAVNHKDPLHVHCEHEHDVIGSICDSEQPWSRCENVTDDRLQDLKRLCTLTTSTVQATTSSSTSRSTSTTTVVRQAPTHRQQTTISTRTYTDAGEVNIGLIAGLAAAVGVLLLLFIIGVFIYLRVKGRKHQRQGSQHNPAYSFGSEEVYSSIDDHALIDVQLSLRSDSRLINPSLPSRTTSIGTNGILSNRRADTAVGFDNSAFVRNVHSAYANPATQIDRERLRADHGYAAVFPQASVVSDHGNNKNESLERREHDVQQTGSVGYIDQNGNGMKTNHEYDILSGSPRKYLSSETEPGKSQQERAFEHQQDTSSIDLHSSPVDNGIESVTYSGENDSAWNVNL